MPPLGPEERHAGGRVGPDAVEEAVVLTRVELAEVGDVKGREESRDGKGDQCEVCVREGEPVDDAHAERKVRCEVGNVGK